MKPPLCEDVILDLGNHEIKQGSYELACPVAGASSLRRRSLGWEKLAGPVLGKGHPIPQMGKSTELWNPRRLSRPKRGEGASPDMAVNPPRPSCCSLVLHNPLLCFPSPEGEETEAGVRVEGGDHEHARVPFFGIFFNTLKDGIQIYHPKFF